MHGRSFVAMATSALAPPAVGRTCRSGGMSQCYYRGPIPRRTCAALINQGALARGQQKSWSSTGSGLPIGGPGRLQPIHLSRPTSYRFILNPAWQVVQVCSIRWKICSAGTDASCALFWT